MDLSKISDYDLEFIKNHLPAWLTQQSSESLIVRKNLKCEQLSNIHGAVRLELGLRAANKCFELIKEQEL